MEIKKSYWTTNGNDISLAVPFVKVDQKKRIVSGFATLDNIDKHGDIVDTAASMTAFTRFRGNIREMHQPIAVGKVVSFRQEDFYDKATKKNYSGVFVDVYVSKGAQDTWEKVLDGTLSGFSIGGSINKADTVTDNEEYDGPVRVIKDYDLVELSLVDNPANQFANVFSIQKSDIGFKVTGMATEIKTLNVFFCESDEIAVSSEDIARDCTVCNSTMKNIGWIEQASDNKAAVADLVEAYVSKNTVNEGGIEKMADEPEVAEPAAEEAAEEAPAEESEIEKMLNGIKTYITDALTKASDTPDVQTLYDELLRQIESTKADMAGMGERHNTMMKAVEDCTNQIAELAKRMDAYESATAMKKSSDLETESVEPLKKNTSIWKGHFLGVSDLS